MNFKKYYRVTINKNTCVTCSLYDSIEAQQNAAAMKSFFDSAFDRETKLRIKRALVSVSNKAKVQGNFEVAKIYENTYKQMVLPEKPKVKHCKETSEHKPIPDYMLKHLLR